MKNVEIQLTGTTYKQWVNNTCKVILKPPTDIYRVWGIFEPIRSIDVGFAAGSPEHCFWLWSSISKSVVLWEGNYQGDTTSETVLLLKGVGDLYKVGQSGSGILYAPGKSTRTNANINWRISTLQS